MSCEGWSYGSMQEIGDTTSYIKFSPYFPFLITGIHLPLSIGSVLYHDGVQ